MTIVIVTVYNSYNCGSYLQAYALYKTLKEKGSDVYFLKREPYRLGTFRYRLCKSIKAFLKCHFRDSQYILREHFRYKKAQKILPKTDNLNCADLVIYGSDTIWNMETAYFRDNWEKYWGKGVENKKITYAASVGSTNASVFYDNQAIKKCIKEFSGVSVRDDHTYKIAENLLDDEKPTMVVDPTMLLSVDDYSEIMGKCHQRGFILVYYFGKMTKEQNKALKEFAKSQNKKIISFGKNIPFSPELMLSYFKAADYIVTNTFHGNVFSIIFNKKFVSYGKEQKKVVSLLQEFGLLHRLLDSEIVFDEVLSADIDYIKVNEILNSKRSHSLNYLGKFISEFGGESYEES